MPNFTAQKADEMEYRIIRQHHDFMSVNEVNSALTEVCEAGIDRFGKLKLPRRKHEMFTYVNTADAFDEDCYFAAHEASVTINDIKKHIYPGSEKSVIVFVNGRYNRELSSLCHLAHAIKIKTFQQLTLEPEMREYLVDEARTENDPFASLNTAFATDGLAVEIGSGFKIEYPLQILYFTTASYHTVTTPRILIKVSGFSDATLLVKFAGEEGGYFVNAGQDILLEEGASMKYYHMQADDRLSVNFTKTRFILNRNSRVSAVAAYSGSRINRHHIETKMREEGAEFSLGSLSLLDGESTSHNYVRISHEAPNCASDQLFRNIVMDKSHSSVDGTVIVREGATQSRSSQLINNLMLSGDAKADTKPNLMIYNDDVKCSHGATVGRADEEQLFYLRSRGLPRAKAVAALTAGFAGLVVEKITHMPFADEVRSSLLSRLER